MRTYVTITLIFLLLLGGGLYLKDSYASAGGQRTSKTKTRTVSNSTTETPTQKADTTSKTGGTPTSTEAKKTTSITSTCGQGGACTGAEVAAHNTRADCWVSMGVMKKVYNITLYVVNGGAMHPGGDVIADYCGADIYDAFTGKNGGHRHSSRALNYVLEAYYVGPLK